MLILTGKTYSSSFPSIVSAEFNSKATCESAGKEVSKLLNDSRYEAKYICVIK